MIPITVIHTIVTRTVQWVLLDCPDELGVIPIHFRFPTSLCFWIDLTFLFFAPFRFVLSAEGVFGVGDLFHQRVGDFHGSVMGLYAQGLSPFLSPSSSSYPNSVLSN